MCEHTRGPRGLPCLGRGKEEEPAKGEKGELGRLAQAERRMCFQKTRGSTGSSQLSRAARWGSEGTTGFGPVEVISDLDKDSVNE